jgi:putative peptide zinc metalloprotease protein
VLALGGLVAVDVWAFFVHGVGQSARQLVYQPALLIMIFGLVALATFLHECGHATACRYGGAKPGVMGAGIFILWPAFYTDVTDAYRLDRVGRLRTDLGGIYFNGVFCLMTAGAYALTSFEPLLIVIAVQHLQMLQQLLPFLRLDGYYIISDLTGVPDIFRRIKPVLRSLLPGREPDTMVKELKPWVQKVVTLYVIALIPAFVAVFAALGIGAPRMFATAYDSFFVQIDHISDALSNGAELSVAAGSIQILSLLVPTLGFALTSGRIARRLGTGAWRMTDGRPRLRGGMGAATAAAVALVAFLWWPNGEYRPVQPGERGTLTGAVASLAETPSGRPGLTRDREEALGGAHTVREQGGDFRRVHGVEGDRPEAPVAPDRAPGNREREAPAEEPSVPEDTVTPEEAPAPAEEPEPPAEEPVPPADTPVPPAEEPVPPADEPVPPARPEPVPEDPRTGTDPTPPPATP